VILLSLLLALAPCARADEGLLSLPGLATAVADTAKNARPLGFVDFHGTYGGGVMVPIRTLKDSSGVRYAALGAGGTIKQGEHFRPRLVVIADASAIYRRIEKRARWWDTHTEKLPLPDFWIGPSLETPMPGDRVTWSDFANVTTWARFLGVALAVGF